MRKLLIYLIILIVIVGCGSSDNLASFSKRKYLKKPPKQKDIEQFHKDEPIVFASTELEYSDYVLEEIPEVDYEQVIEQKQEENTVIHIKIEDLPKPSNSKIILNYEFKNQSKSDKSKFLKVMGYIILYISAFFGCLALMTLVWGGANYAAIIAGIAIVLAIGAYLLIKQPF